MKVKFKKKLTTDSKRNTNITSYARFKTYKVLISTELTNISGSANMTIRVTIIEDR